MNVGELFISLGVKGSEKSVSQINNVNNNLKGTKEMSLEAKAAILAAVYALEQMMVGAAKTGTSLLNLQALTGENTKELQQWEYRAKMAGSSAEEMAPLE